MRLAYVLTAAGLLLSACGGGSAAGTTYAEVNTVSADCGNHWLGVLEAPGDAALRSQRARTAIPACETAVRTLAAATVAEQGDETLRSLQQRALDSCRVSAQQHLAVFQNVAGGGTPNFNDQRDAVEAERACATARVAWSNAAQGARG